MSQFYQLTLSEIISLYKEGEVTTSCAIKLYIKIKFAPGWKIVIDRDKVMEAFGISIHQFRRAIAKLKNTFDIFVSSVKQVAQGVCAQSVARRDLPATAGCAAVKKVTPSVNNVAASANKVTPSAHIDPQTPNKTSNHSDPPDLRPDLDHISLSDKQKPKIDRVGQLPEEEREKFLNFAMDGVNQLPNRPSLPSKWIKNNFEELYSEFKLSSAPETQKATEDRQFAEWYDLMKQLGHVTGQKVENGVQMVETHGGFWSTYERKSQSYTLEYLRKGVRGR